MSLLSAANFRTRLCGRVSRAWAINKFWEHREWFKELRFGQVKIRLRAEMLAAHVFGSATDLFNALVKNLLLPGLLLKLAMISLGHAADRLTWLTHVTQLRVKLNLLWIYFLYSKMTAWGTRQENLFGASVLWVQRKPTLIDQYFPFDRQ